MRFTTAALAEGLGGTLHGPDVTVDGAAIDSRTLPAGALFVAVSETRDGHDFVEAAMAAGAGAALVHRPTGPGPCVVVPDTAVALSRLGAMARRRLPERVVGITGSVGKTTTKDLLASVLTQRFVTAASERSFNNELGVPLTLANAAEDTEAAVVEMGARGHGHIAELCSVALPTAGVVTTVSGVHTEMMGGLDQIAVAKRELVESLPPDGVAVLNADDPRVAAMAHHTRAGVLTFGGAGDVTMHGLSGDHELRAAFTLHSPWGSTPVRLGVRGLHNVPNALAAAAVGLWAGVPLEGVAAGLAEPPASPWRMELDVAPSGARVLNDAYNAGPASMAAALRALAALPARRHVAVLGVMAELGSDEAAEHAAVAELAEELGVRVVAVGTDLYGVDPVPDVDAAVAALGELGEDDAVLVKASRVVGLERVAAALLKP